MTWRLRNMPIWCFHGALDNVVPLERDQQMISAVKKYNANVKFTIYPDTYHNSWEKAYDNDSIYTWLLSQKKFSYKEIKTDVNVLKKYAGTFVGSNGDTISINVDSLGLHAKAHENNFLLKAAGNDVFFIFENMPVDLKFLSDQKGKRDSFIVFEDNKTSYKRIK